MANSEYRSYNSDAIVDGDDQLSSRIVNEVVKEDPIDDESGDNYTNEEPQEPKRRGKIVEYLFLMLTGNVLTMREVSKYYSHMIVVAMLFLVSIMVLFGSLHLDVNHNRLSNEVQMLREKSVRLKEVRSERSSHSAILKELNRRGIDLEVSKQPAIINGDF
ncbi:MAG: FtsL-like putative cell division protein [Rikenellaceae bacterium]